VHLLSGLILAVIIFAMMRPFLAGRPAIPIVFLILSSLTLLAKFPGDLLGMQFWAGAVGFVAILSAMLVVLHPNPMISVLFLILNLFCIALFYLMLQAQILAALQVIVYAGAIMVLFVFVVMLLNLKAEEGLRLTGGRQRSGALLLGVAFAGLMFWAIEHRRGLPYFRPGTFLEGFGTARDLGNLMFHDYILAFEAASILLVAAMVGAVLLAKRRLQ